MNQNKKIVPFIITPVSIFNQRKYGKLGNWTNKQKLKVCIFLDYHLKFFSQKANRRFFKLFNCLSFFVKSRTPSQCRSHYQKMKKHYCNQAEYIQEVKKRIGNQTYNHYLSLYWEELQMIRRQLGYARSQENQRQQNQFNIQFQSNSSLIKSQNKQIQQQPQQPQLPQQSQFSQESSQSSSLEDEKKDIPPTGKDLGEDDEQQSQEEEESLQENQKKNTIPPTGKGLINEDSDQEDDQSHENHNAYHQSNELYKKIQAQKLKLLVLANQHWKKYLMYVIYLQQISIQQKFYRF